jgi:D-inositol-3-phosphate glycosyltransferase
VALVTFHACPLAAPGQGKSGGMNVYVQQLARSLGNLGVTVDIFTRQHPDSASLIEEISPGVRVIHLPGGDANVPMEDLFSYLPGFLEAVREFRAENNLTYDAVHSHYWLSGWVGRALARDMDVPHVATFHTLSLIKMQSRAGEAEPIHRQRVERELMADTDQIVAFSPHERDAMARLYDADPDHIELVPCGVDLARFQPLNQEESRAKLGLNGDKVLLFVGRIESLKGLDLLVHTAAQMETRQGMRVLVVGGDDGKEGEAARVRQLVQDLDMDEIFDFVGRVDQEDMPLYYSAADVCVVPSFYESFGLAALESMACGTPVVASRVGGLSTVIQHGRTGYLKSWRCPEAFANSLEMIISSKRLQNSMGIAARKRAEDLGWDQVAERMLRIYQRSPKKVPSHS